MNSKKILWIAVPVVLVLWFISINNRLVKLDEGVNAAWSQVENVYQRRLDLIPNLVNTVKGYAKHEASVLTEVTEARSQAGQVKINRAEDLKTFEEAQTKLSGALSRLLAVSENYPNLKADANFRELQSQLEGSENRITVERMRFNEIARDFNTTVRSFPTSLIAGMRGFKERAYFQAAPGANQAPKVEF